MGRRNEAGAKRRRRDVETGCGREQSAVKLLGENPVSVPGNGNNGQENALSMKGAEEERPEIKDRERQPAMEFSQTEMDSEEGDGKEKKKKTRKLGKENKNDLN